MWVRAHNVNTSHGALANGAIVYYIKI